MPPIALETVAENGLPSGQKKVDPTSVHHKADDNNDDDPSTAVKSLGLLDPLSDHRESLKLSGSLDKFEQFDVTPILGTEFVDVDLAEWIRAPQAESDALLRDLAITISQRGVVFFRKQDSINEDLQKELVQRLGALSGKPATSKLHIHPVYNSARGLGGKDNQISVVDSVQEKGIYGDRFFDYGRRQSQRSQWHSDITFEKVSSDYALLRMTKLPRTGGDRIYSLGFRLRAIDRISPPLRGFLDTLTAHYSQPSFAETAARNNFSLYSESRGAPENVGPQLEATHPVVRTNPVTGWKSVFAVGQHVQSIHGLSEAESRHFLDWFVSLITENHDLQLRHRWRDINDLAIWDNLSAYHAATPDYLEEELNLGARSGSRAVSLGERPYFDPDSQSRREALGFAAVAV